MGGDVEDLVGLLTTTPSGAAWLAALERPGPARTSEGKPLDEQRMRATIDSVRGRPVAELLATAVRASIDIAGSWWSDAPAVAASALRAAPERLPLAEAIVERLGAHLTAPIDRARQECWRFNRPYRPDESSGPLGSPRRPCGPWVTATFDGLWTVTQPSPALIGPLLLAWEYDFKPITRWHLTVADDARVFEVNAPRDWEHLVTPYPLAVERRPNSSWEIPGANQDDRQTLAGLAGQRAQRTSMRRFVEPEWNAVAEDYDGIHLTWAGFLTCEGTAIDLPDGDVAMLRNWHSERVLWLNPVLRDPRPINAPPAVSDGLGYDDWMANPETDPARLAEDLDWFRHKLST